MKYIFHNVHVCTAHNSVLVQKLKQENLIALKQI